MKPRRLTLPIDSDERKGIPMWRGCLAYFAAALAGVARHSRMGNDKHNPGQEMHHARGKSTDHADCIVRHLFDVYDMEAAIERGQDVDVRELLDEADALSWRSLALSQRLHEKYGGAPLAPGAREPEEPRPSS